MRGTFLGVAAAGLLPFAAGAVTMETVPVGDVGNAWDPSDGATNIAGIQNFGSVAYDYGIGKFEVQNNQYTEFLNSVASFGDTYGLYDPSMGSDVRGCISQSGSGTLVDPYVYSPKANMGDKPVNYVSFYDAVRFVNWLENGQPTGTNQVAGTTETGSYTLFTSGSSTTNVSARGANATWVIPTENEWYKAAYYDPTASGTSNYWFYPTQSDSVPTIGLVDATGNITNDGPNVANFNRGADWNGQDGNVTTVGSAGASSDSYYGTFDQGGNITEWTETIVAGNRVIRGHNWSIFGEINMGSWARFDLSPSTGPSGLGFRVAMIPEPGAFAALILAGLAGLAWRRRSV